MNHAESVANQLGEAIATGTYSEGATLPNENMLSDQYAVSRSVIREAIKMLSVKGFIASRLKRGTWVQPRRSWNLFNAEAFRSHCKSRPSPEVLLECLDFRLGFESMAAAMASKQADTGLLQELRRAQFFIETPTGGSPSAVEYHQAILRASGNVFFAQTANSVELSMLATTRRCLLDPSMHLRRYQQVTRCLCDHNARGAQLGMRHLLREQRLCLSLN